MQPVTRILYSSCDRIAVLGAERAKRNRQPAKRIRGDIKGRSPLAGQTVSRRLCAHLLCLLLGLAEAAGAAQDRTLVVSAASSLIDVVGEIAAVYETAHGTRVRVTTGGSNTLARQIVEGARVDVFLSADDVQMDVVERAGRIVEGTRRPLLTNSLVVITPVDSALTLRTAQDLAQQSVRRLALGQPESVPAGVYAKEWLEQRGLWEVVRSKVVPLSTVRAALAAVREGRVDAGVVYATDARTTADVRVAFAVPANEVPPITYPVAAVRGSREDEARRFLQFLGDPKARAIFEGAAFGVVITTRSSGR
jgi:molybdate transport system substrate-binding protein